MPTLQEAVLFCIKFEKLLGPEFHVALTGGCLYSEEGGHRKDIDIIVYEHNNKRNDVKVIADRINKVCDGSNGFSVEKDYGRVIKVSRDGVMDIDILIPGRAGFYDKTEMLAIKDEEFAAKFDDEIPF